MSANRYLATKPTPLASVVIPAFNEENVIERCLEALLRDADPGELDVVVACNGCVDRTAEIASAFGADVRVVTVEHASKTDALNLGDRTARWFPRVYLDADLVVSTDAVRRLVEPLVHGKALAAVGFMSVDLRGCSPPVRAFYGVWALHPYLSSGKFGGIYALSRDGAERRGPYPAVIADDAYVRERFAPGEWVAVEACRFGVSPPRTLRGLVRVRTRVHLGNLELSRRAHESRRCGSPERTGLVGAALRTPSRWHCLPIYAVVNLIAKNRARRMWARRDCRWERDESSRATTAPAG